MSNFRYDKFIVGVLCLVMIAILSACQNKQSESLEALSLTCADIQYSATSGKPMELIKLRSIPSDFGERLSFVMYSDDGENNMLIPVEYDGDEGEASFHLPVHPNVQLSGGEVKLALIDEQDHQCDAVTFTIEALSEAPGAFKKLVNFIVEIGDVQARLFDIDVNSEPQIHIIKDNPIAAVHFIVDDFVRGDSNPDSMLRIADNDSAILGELSEEQWKLIDGLVAHSGILSAMEDYIANLKTLEPITFDSSLAYYPLKTSGIVTISSANNVGGIPLTCDTPLHRPSAALLDQLMNMQVKNEIFGDGTELLDASAMLWGASGVLATAGGLPQLGKLAGTIVTGIDLMKLRYDMMEGLLPSEFIELNVNASPVEFLEDDVILDGTWDQALVKAKSRGWSADKAVFGLLINKLGGRISKGAQQRLNIKLDEGVEALDKFARGQRNSRIANELYGETQDRTGVYEFPPCEFGPTDISDENWSDVQMITEKGAPIYLVDRYTYRVQKVGEGVLEVSPRGDRFGRRTLNANGMFFSSDTLIKAKQIEVDVSPSELSVMTGTSTQFRATVHNANDKGVIWEVHPAGPHRVTIRTEPDGRSILMIDTSYDEEDFPITITAISTSSTGLRALPHAPRREGHALMRSTSQSVEIIPRECCVAPGEQQSFQAIVHNLNDRRVTWEASAGTISKDGVFTAPDEAAFVTVTATSVAEPHLQDSAIVIVGDCDCWAGWEIEAFNEKQTSNTSRIERAGEDGEGRLTKIHFMNITNGENMQIVFEGEGPLPDEQGTYPVKIINTANEMSDRSIIFKNGTVVGVPDPFEQNGFYVMPPAHLISEDEELEPIHDELLATVTINEFTQLGSDHHHVWISGTIQGRVEAVEYREDLPFEANMSAMHLFGSISGSFQGHYTVRHNNPTVNPLSSLGIEVPFIGEGSVYWDVCGLEASDIPFATSGPKDSQHMPPFDEYIDQMDPDDFEEFEAFMEQSGLDGLGDIFNLFQ